VENGYLTRITTFMLGSSSTELMILLGVSVSIPSNFSTHCLFQNFLNTSIFQLRNLKQTPQKSRPVLRTIGRYFQAHIDIPHSPARDVYSDSSLKGARPVRAGGFPTSDVRRHATTKLEQNRNLQHFFGPVKN